MSTAAAHNCWTYPGAKTGAGYGSAWVNGRWVLVHRAAYEALVGPIPVGLELDHLCRNRACYNPAHLEPVTRAENARRGVPNPSGSIAFWRGRTHCPSGHPYDEANTAVRPNGQRRCKTCNREQSRRRKSRRKTQ